MAGSEDTKEMTLYEKVVVEGVIEQFIGRLTKGYLCSVCGRYGAVPKREELRHKYSCQVLKLVELVNDRSQSS